MKLLISSLIIGVTSVAFVGCSESSDPGRRAMEFRIGRPMADLIREAGPPTDEERVRAERRDTLCQDSIARGADRALVYDLPTTGIRAFVRRHFGLQPDLTVVVCIDRAGVVVDRYNIIR